ncbi:MAG: 50S ribosomal protein L11 methyltransferase [Gemmatimonadaceae bacterium]
MTSDGNLKESAWIALRVNPGGDPQRVISALFAAGSQGIQEDGDAIVTHFPPGTPTDEIVHDIMDADPRARVAISLAPRMDWSEWRASVGAHQVGSLTIAPPWLAEDLDPATTVIIEPAMAFGTGEHATTRGVARLLQHLSPMPFNVADIGAGSAVLSICAAKLGAGRVVAVEIDEDAIGNAEENVRTNEVEGRVHVMQGDATTLLPLLAPVDLVMANIISSVLTELLPVVAESLAPRGHAILSGILQTESEAMLGEIENGGWTVIAEDREDAWWSVLIAHP